ncbi:aspartate--tRNA ligase [bacterium]|nr:aspartate--tRNA ligase [bacterium]
MNSIKPAPAIRTHNIEQIIHAPIGETARLCGWVQHRRDLGQLIFITLRDRWGEMQCVIDPAHSEAAHALAEGLRNEYVVAFSGATRPRPEKEVRAYPGGDREFLVDGVELLTAAEPLPFNVEEDVKASEELRLKYRYIDLRRRAMVRAMTIRHKCVSAIRSYLNSHGFLEIETPMLARATPEGARDYVVPSRVHPGEFYALPQSPQLYKQVLMCSGLDRYYQIARCLRDEDLRGNRQPEHTQLDLEMSCATRDELFSIAEGAMHAVWRECLGEELPHPFPRLPYREAMALYGSDKPDLRFGSRIVELSGQAQCIDAAWLKSDLELGKCVHGIFIPGASLSRKQYDEWTAQAKELGAGGLMTIELSGEEPKGSVAKFLTDSLAFAQAAESAEGNAHGTWFMVVGDTPSNYKVLGQLRLALGREFKLIDEGKWAFLWVVDFPLYEASDEPPYVTPSHHPFTMPVAEDQHKLESEDPAELLSIRSDNYDLVLNGVEMSSGSLRINKPDLQLKVLRRIGLSDEQIEDRFGWFLGAYRYGAPPHRGFGQGIDRLVMSLLSLDNIREVIAFPKTASAQCPLTGAPAPIDDAQWSELGIKSR